MDWNCDREADAAYLRLTGAAIVESEEVAADAAVDLDAEARIVGNEVLQASRRLSATVLSPTEAAE